jgi:hypothetical protein
MTAVRLVAITSVAVVLTACADTGGTETFTDHGVTFVVPPGWSVTGFSRSVWPRRLVAASYRVGAADVEGDCGGLEAVQRLPAGGAYIVLIDYGAGSASLRDFPDALPVATLAEGQLAEFECFGRSFAFRFRSAGRALQAHVGVGQDATRERRAEALALLNSIRVGAS